MLKLVLFGGQLKQHVLLARFRQIAGPDAGDQLERGLESFRQSRGSVLRLIELSVSGSLVDAAGYFLQASLQKFRSGRDQIGHAFERNIDAVKKRFFMLSRGNVRAIAMIPAREGAGRRNGGAAVLALLITPPLASDLQKRQTSGGGIRAFLNLERGSRLFAGPLLGHIVVKADRNIFVDRVVIHALRCRRKKRHTSIYFHRRPGL